MTASALLSIFSMTVPVIDGKLKHPTYIISAMQVYEEKRLQLCVGVHDAFKARRYDEGRRQVKFS